MEEIKEKELSVIENSCSSKIDQNVYTIDAAEFTNTNTGYYYGTTTSSGYGRKSEDLIVVGHRE